MEPHGTVRLRLVGQFRSIALLVASIQSLAHWTPLFG
jgi:hypothetical protein